MWKGDIHSLLGLVGKYVWPCARGKSSAPGPAAENSWAIFGQNTQGSASQGELEPDTVDFSAGRVGNLADCFFSSLDLNNEMGIWPPLLADMVLGMQMLLKITPLPWERNKWGDPNSTWGALFHGHAPTSAHSKQAEQSLGVLIPLAFIYICESGIPEIWALKNTQIFIINPRPKMTYIAMSKSTPLNQTASPYFEDVLLKLKIHSLILVA